MNFDITKKSRENEKDNEQLPLNDYTKLSKKSIGLLVLSDNEVSLKNYNAEKYIIHVNELGLEVIWAHILNHVQINGTDKFLNPNNFGAMYEAGLAELDKNDKKKSGQYFTPSDVSKLMASWLKELSGSNICDVGCGTGNLILAYLDLIGKKHTVELLKNRRVYLYDFDKVAITIAQYSIALIYGFEYLGNINIVYGDFLNTNIVLPENSKIISNPPYAKYGVVPEQWTKSKIQFETKELYAAFMEKIITSNNTGVIITPFSYLGGSKFQKLRNLLSMYNGFIVAFDNVPGNIFNGRKHGIFNTNTANSVRAAITVVENINYLKGFKTTHLIRFKNEERNELLKSEVLKSQLSEKYQITNLESKMFARCHVKLENCFYNWTTKSSSVIKDMLATKESEHTLYMPNTCRYYTTASKKKLMRGGYLTISVEDVDKFNYLYCLINSSFVYWWWRIYDGGITYPVSLFNSIPVFYNLLNEEDKVYLSNIACEMISNENQYTVTKMNAGSIQENIKFPKKYRDAINERLIKILSCSSSFSDFDVVHVNSFFGGLEEIANED